MTQSLAPRDLDAHRAQIAVEVEIILDGYWQNRPGDKMRVAILADWMDELEDWHVDQIRWALRHWRSLHPSKKPNPGHIVATLKAKRGQAYVAQRDGGSVDNLFSVSRPLQIETML